MNEYTQQHILTIPIHLFHCLHSSLQLYQSPYGPLSLFYHLSLWPLSLSLSLSLWPLILIMDSWPLFPQNLAKQQFILINNNNNRSSYFPKKTIKLVFPRSHQRFPFLFFFLRFIWICFRYNPFPIKERVSFSSRVNLLNIRESVGLQQPQ